MPSPTIATSPLARGVNLAPLVLAAAISLIVLLILWLR
jgi:hypothetical protein